MPALLAIGSDPGWLAEVCAAAAASGVAVVACPSLPDAVSMVASEIVSPVLVVVDADCWTPRTDPALRVIRARVARRFVAAFAPASERVARDMPCDICVPKADLAFVLRRELLVAL